MAATAASTGIAVSTAAEAVAAGADVATGAEADAPPSVLIIATGSPTLTTSPS